MRNRSPDGAKRNPGAEPACETVPDFAEFITGQRFVPTPMARSGLQHHRHCERSNPGFDAEKQKAGSLRRFRLRSLTFGGKVAPRNDGERVSAGPLSAC